jgi:putative polyhydroxyalkanoate system protein
VPDIRVSHKHQLGADGVKARLGGFTELLAKYRVSLAWDGPRAQIGGIPGVSGHVHLKEDEVEILVSLSRMVTMMGVDPVKLESSIRKRLEEGLAA